MSALMEVLRLDGERLEERRAAPQLPRPVNRADRIIADAHAARQQYRREHPDADTAMVFSFQVGYLNGMVRALCAELDALRGEVKS